MPVRKGNVAPQNTFIDTIIKKFDGQSRNFLIANVQVETTPIIYCNEGFCALTGFSRAEVMQKDCLCPFLHGEDTDMASVLAIKRTIEDSRERIIELLLYKKTGEAFLCSVLLAPVKNEVQEIIMYILNFEDISTTAAGALAKTTTKPHDIAGLSWISRMARKWNSRSNGASATPTDRDPLQEDSGRSSASSRPSDSPQSANGIPLQIVVESDVSDLSTLSSARSPSQTSDTRPTVGGTGAGTDATPSKTGVQLPSLREQRSMSVGSLVGAAVKGAEKAPLSKSTSCKSEPAATSSPLAGGVHGGGPLQLLPTKKGSVSGGVSAPRGHTMGMTNRVAKALMRPLKKVLSLDVDYKMQSATIHRCTILHYSLFKAAWDWFILILVLYTAIVTPYVAAFVLSDINLRSKHHGVRLEDPISVIDLFVDIFFLVDIAINFRTTYVNKHDEVVSHHGKIAVHYFKGWFLIDMVAAIPFDLLLYGSETDETATLIGLLKTARLLRLVRVVRKLDRYSEYGAAVLMLLMAVFALIAHWLACIWYAIGESERPTMSSGTSLSWLAQLGVQIEMPYNETGAGGPDIYSKYITALYFTFSSLTSVGFGNISPNTNSEKVFSIVIMLIGSLMYASIFGNVSAIIQRVYSSTARYHSEMGRIKEFIKFHQIPNPLRQRLEEYFQHAWSYTNGIDMNMVLKGFPECLQADICLHLNKNLVTESKSFVGASPGCMRALSMRFHTTHVPPGDTLVHRGDVLNALYFISRGSIEILRDNMIMAILGKSDVFGENVCLYKSVGKSSCNVRALTYCDLHKISRVDLIEILQMYPEFAESFEANLEVTYNLRDEELTIADPDQEDPGGHGRSRWKVLFKKLAVKPEDEVEEKISGKDTSEGDADTGRGILEFSPNRAGQDITPLNLDFQQANRQVKHEHPPPPRVGMAMTNVLNVLSLGHSGRLASPGPAHREDEEKVPLMHDSSAAASVSNSSYHMPSSASGHVPPGLSQSTTTTTLPFSLSSTLTHVDETVGAERPAHLPLASPQSAVTSPQGSVLGPSQGSDVTAADLDRKIRMLETHLGRLESKVDHDLSLILHILNNGPGTKPGDSARGGTSDSPY